MAGGVHGKGMHGRGACMCRRGTCVAGGHAWGACLAGKTATSADGTYSTGMHSC